MADQEEYKNILVVADLVASQGQGVALEMVGKARELAEMLGVWVYAAALSRNGNGAGKFDTAQKATPPEQSVVQAKSGSDLIAYGADSVYLMKADLPKEEFDCSFDFICACLDALACIVQEVRPEIVMFPETPFGVNIAPRLAQRFSTGLVTGCVRLELEIETRMLIATKTGYQGLLLMDVAFPHHRPQMVTVKRGAHPPGFEDPSREGKVQEIALSRGRRS